jgi:hypothetical protein
MARCLAQRRLPSMMMAMCCGAVDSSGNGTMAMQDIYKYLVFVAN